MKLTKEQIADYVNKARKGDREAFSKLYQDNVNQIYYICLKLLKNDEDAKDVTQDTFVTAIEKITTLVEAEYFSTWVNHIAVNKCKNILVKNNQIVKEELYDSNYEEVFEETNKEFIPEEYVTDKEKRSIIMDIIDNKLSDVQRMAVLLYYYEGESVGDIAKILNCSEGTVKSRLSSARKLIRKAIEDKENRGMPVLGVVTVFALSRIFMEEARASVMPQNAFETVMDSKFNQMEVKTAGMIHKSLGLKIAIGVAGIAAAVGIGVGIAHMAGNGSDKDNTPTGENITIAQEETTDGKPAKETESQTDEADNVDMSEEEIINYIIENNGRLPYDMDEDALTGVEKIVVILVDGFKNLDAEVMKPFISEEDYNSYKEYFDYVLADEELHALWKDTIGELIYYPDSEACVLKDTEWVYQAWYTDCYRNNADIPASDAEEFSKEYLMDIYNKYYDKAPYIVETGVNHFEYEIEDGFLKIDMNNFFEDMGYARINDIFYTDFYGICFNYSILIMGDVKNLSLGYDYISSDEDSENNIYNVDAFLDKDIDTIVEMARNIDEEYQNGITWGIFNVYFFDEANRTKIKQYVNDNCYFLRGLSHVTLYMPCDDNFLSLEQLNDKDRADLKAKDIDIMEKKPIFAYPGNLDDLTAFYYLVELMQCKGLLETVYFN